MKRIKKYKWLINWIAFAILVGIFAFVGIRFEDKTWLPNFLQAAGTITGIYLTITIFLQSKEESDKQFIEHIDHLQQLNAKQILALQSSTDQQIKTLQELNNKQISALQDLTDKQIKALQDLTERQIEALHKTTFEQISSFEQQTREVTNKLSDNSILLAEILARELEKSINFYSGEINKEQAKYEDLTGWKLFRTQQQREQQLNNQWGRIVQFKQGYDYLVSKYNKVKEFLGFGQKKLDG